MYLNQELSLLGVLSWEYGSRIGEPALRVDGGEVFREEEERARRKAGQHPVWGTCPPERFRGAKRRAGEGLSGVPFPGP